MQSLCGAKKRDGEPCQARPMQNGRCRMHGGTNPGAPIRTGRYSLKHRASLAEKAETFLNDPTPGDLTGELALMRALLQDYIDRFPDSKALGLDDIESIYVMLEAIGKTVERIARILNQTALTQAEAQLLQARLAEIAVKYVDVNKRDRFFEELRSAFGHERGLQSG